MPHRRWLPMAMLILTAGDGPWARREAEGGPQTAGGLRFEVVLAPELGQEAVSGRLLVVLDRRDGGAPWRSIGPVHPSASPVLGRDVRALRPGEAVAVDRTAVAFPIAGLDALPAGTYSVQALLRTNRDLLLLDAPGNLTSDVVRRELDPARPETVRLTLRHRFGPQAPPPESEAVRYVEVPSRALSAFHGRPMALRAGVILPRGYEAGSSRRYPLRIRVGGYGTRYTAVGAMMAPGAGFRQAWEDPRTPPMVVLHLDGAGPLGDPYQVDSANHGPYGTALLTELIPEVERRFGCGGRGRRVLDGVSTGGWVALALQVSYPDEFAGAWSSSPDPVDFRSFQRVNIYEDEDAYRDGQGRERPACRRRDGAVRYTMRQECALENVLGEGDSYVSSGGQWGAWNAAFSHRGPDGRPRAIWDPRTGRIDREVAEHWRAYDLRLRLERDWAALGPKLRGKLHVWAAGADEYFLDEAARRLADFLERADPPFVGTFAFGPGEGHGWLPLSERELMQAMDRAMRAGREGE